MTGQVEAIFGHMDLQQRIRLSDLIRDDAVMWVRHAEIVARQDGEFTSDEVAEGLRYIRRCAKQHLQIADWFVAQ